MKKISLALATIVFVCCFTSMYSQPKLTITLKNKELLVKKNPEPKGKLDLVDIEKVNPNIILDIRYATANNVMKKVLYSSAKCYFRKHVAQALDHAQKELETMGLGLKIYDGYRPWQVQVDLHKDFPNLAAPPTEKRCRHPRGTAVDLTLVDKSGKEIFMPTEFDDTTIKAARTTRKGIDPKAIENREVLAQIMVKHGFIPLSFEWWHFDHYTWKAYSPIKLTFEEIAKTLG